MVILSAHFFDPNFPVRAYTLDMLSEENILTGMYDRILN